MVAQKKGDRLLFLERERTLVIQELVPFKVACPLFRRSHAKEIRHHGG